MCVCVLVCVCGGEGTETGKCKLPSAASLPWMVASFDGKEERLAVGQGRKAEKHSCSTADLLVHSRLEQLRCGIERNGGGGLRGEGV